MGLGQVACSLRFLNNPRPNCNFKYLEDQLSGASPKIVQDHFSFGIDLSETFKVSLGPRFRDFLRAIARTRHPQAHHEEKVLLATVHGSDLFALMQTCRRISVTVPATTQKTVNN